MKFLQSVVSEIKQVTWPSGKDIARYTTTVLVTIVVAAAFFAIVDYSITAIVNLFLN